MQVTEEPPADPDRHGERARARGRAAGPDERWLAGAGMDQLVRCTLGPPHGQDGGPGVHQVPGCGDELPQHDRQVESGDHLGVRLQQRPEPALGGERVLRLGRQLRQGPLELEPGRSGKASRWAGIGPGAGPVASNGCGTITTAAPTQRPSSSKREDTSMSKSRGRPGASQGTSSEAGAITWPARASRTRVTASCTPLSSPAAAHTSR